MTQCIILPSVYEPYETQCISGMSKRFFKDLVVIDNTVENKGVARSWNIGARKVLDEGLDFLVSLSASTRFGNKGGADFLDHLDNMKDRWVVESEMPVGWHMIAWSRALLQRVGLFDEHYWPAYGEDADISHRIGLAIAEDGRGQDNLWDVVPVDAWITMNGHGTRLTGIVPDMESIWEYHQKKWGGKSGHEIFSRPWNNPEFELGTW